MRVSICSDIHLEFGDINLQNTDNADVLILGGDNNTLRYTTIVTSITYRTK